MTGKRVFVSFAVEDVGSHERLIREAMENRCSLEFVSMPVTSPSTGLDAANSRHGSLARPASSRISAGTRRTSIGSSDRSDVPMPVTCPGFSCSRGRADLPPNCRH